MWRSDFVGEVPGRFGFELIHHYAQHAAALFPRATARGLHHPQVPASTTGVARFSQQFAGAMGLGVFGVGLSAASAAKNRNDSFLCLAHRGMLPLIISDPASRYSTKSSRLVNEPLV